MVGLWKHRRAWFVATQTALRKARQIVLDGMNIVTSKTSHLRKLVASASLQQFHLASVYVDDRVGSRFWQLQIFIERLVWDIRECRLKRFARACVAPTAQVHLTVASEFCWIQNSGGVFSFNARGFTLHMFLSWSVALFTSNAWQKRTFNVAVRRG
jgi:hypothetical protein